FFFFQAEDGIRDRNVTGVQTCALPICRYLPEINSKNYNLRSFAERTAMNSPIQGSAADIIKIAMIRMQKMLREKGLKAQMLLQRSEERRVGKVGSTGMEQCRSIQNRAC